MGDGVSSVRGPRGGCGAKDADDAEDGELADVCRLRCADADVDADVASDDGPRWWPVLVCTRVAGFGYPGSSSVFRIMRGRLLRLLSSVDNPPRL